VFYPDIESLGNRIDDQIGDLDNSQVAAILGYYSKLRLVRPSFIERLSSKANPMEMSLKLNIRLLSSLGTLQKLYDKSQAASHTASLFLDDKLTAFSALKHFPLRKSRSSKTLWTALCGRINQQSYPTSRWL